MSNNGCAVCKLIRVYLLIAVPLVILVGFGPEIEILREFSLTKSFAALMGIGLVVTVLWKAYHEYYKRR